mgnify:CR=1 FL=1
MFGDVTFAQSPFASLGGATYGVAVSEAATAASTQSVITSFAGARAELATATATQTALANMYASRNEMVLAESTFDTLNNVFNVARAESATATDTNSAAATIIAAISEAAAGSETYVSRADFVALVEEMGLVFDQFTFANFVNAAIAEGATATESLPVRRNNNTINRSVLRNLTCRSDLRLTINVPNSINPARVITCRKVIQRQLHKSG